MNKGVLDCNESKHRYRIQVSGTGVNEVYEFHAHFTCEDVKRKWLSDVEGSWGTEMVQILEDKVRVTNLCQKKKDSTSELQS